MSLHRTPFIRRFALASAALLASSGAGSARAAEPPPYTIAPAPAWIAPVQAEAELPVPAGAARDGVYELLTDREIRVSAATVERYLHIARKIASPAGIESASELSFAVDPPHERLVIHHIRIRRGGREEDALRPAELHVVQQESGLSERIYNGTLSVIAFLHDVRAGDTIDYAYSVEGWNPVLGPRFADVLPLSVAAPTQHLRVRLLTEAARSINLFPRAWEPKPEERVDGAYRETVWDRRDVPVIPGEDETPRWFNPRPRVEVTEYGSWGEVAAWALPLFESAPRASAELEAQIERLRGAAPDEGGRLLAALRFVQDEIRYLGIELGPGSHQPQSPSVVLERRFGDCKDKTLLLVTLLRALGIKASPALVNPDLGRGLEERAPSPLAFNHVIVRAESGGRTYWLDGTMASQRGGLATLENPDYERALVVAAGTAALTPIPLRAPTEADVDEVEEINAPRYDAPAESRVTTRYRGRAADGMRRRIESTDAAGLSRYYLNYYAHDEPSIVEAAPPVINDDAATDTLTVVESYRIPDFWRQDTKTIGARLLTEALTSPRISRRSMPLAVEHPTLLTHETRLVLPEPIPLDEAPEDLADATSALHCTSSSSGNSVSIRCRYQTLRDFVPVAEVESHLALVDRMRDELVLEVPRGESARGGKAENPWLPIVCVGGVGFGIALLLIAKDFLWSLPLRLRKRAFVRSHAIHQGEAAATAIPVRGRDEMERHMREARCACGTPPGPAPLELELREALFGDRVLTTARVTCAICARTRSRFFSIAA